MERITVIIPTLNEAETIGSMLSSLSQQVVEVIVVDGGSGDSIREIANKFPEVTLITSQPGRAMQMNAGAEAASGDVLLFLHADTALPDGGLELIRQAIVQNGWEWGWFNVRLDGHGILLRLIGWLISLRSRMTSTPSGDMGIFVTTKTFRRIGGYEELPLMEDLDLARRLHRSFSGGAVIACITTSARRWLEGGTVRTVFLMWSLRWMYFLRVSPKRLAKWYADVR